ncbi:MAG: NERD domain-containing protein [Salinibacterium sp.]|nr:nuclease-related domain-containing protein [Salinibacterium sp.]MBF0672610.1 NERD domain-containing protein [Salinibacterium sp.]
MTDDDTAAAVRADPSAIRSFLQAQSAVAPRGWLARLVGRSPLSVESRSWFWAAAGEFEVCRSLSGLHSSLVLHSVSASFEGKPVDHVVVGPGGVFAVHALYAAGEEVVVSALGLRVAGHPLPELRRARHSVGAVERCLMEEAGGEVRVTGVLAVIDAGAVTMTERPLDVAVVDARALSRWIQRQPRTLTDERLAELVQAASRPATWAREATAGCVDPADTATFTRARAEVLAARLTRQLWILVCAASVAFVIVALVLARILSGA